MVRTPSSFSEHIATMGERWPTAHRPPRVGGLHAQVQGRCGHEDPAAGEALPPPGTRQVVIVLPGPVADTIVPRASCGGRR